jgi:hypothetical protein
MGEFPKSFSLPPARRRVSPNQGAYVGRGGTPYHRPRWQRDCAGSDEARPTPRRVPATGAGHGHSSTAPACLLPPNCTRRASAEVRSTNPSQVAEADRGTANIMSFLTRVSGLPRCRLFPRPEPQVLCRRSRRASSTETPPAGPPSVSRVDGEKRPVYRAANRGRDRQRSSPRPGRDGSAASPLGPLSSQVVRTSGRRGRAPHPPASARRRWRHRFKHSSTPTALTVRGSRGLRQLAQHAPSHGAARVVRNWELDGAVALPAGRWGPHPLPRAE